MYTSQNMGGHDEHRMDPKDERLVLMAYNVGKMERATEELWSLKSDLKNTVTENSNLMDRVNSLERSVDSWRSSYYNLEQKYESLKKKTTKKKASRK